jgi:hypothetical protein
MGYWRKSRSTDTGYFPFWFRLAVHAVQSAWLVNLKIPLGWPRPRANWRRCVVDEEIAAGESGASDGGF